MFLRKILLILSAAIFAQTAVAQSSSMSDTSQQSTMDDIKAPTLDGIYSELPTDHTLGSEDAPITMIIYASITCPHCAHWFAGVWPDIKANYVDKGKMRVVYREFITAPAQLGFLGFQIANCAPEEDYFTLIEHQMKEQENTLKGAQDGNAKEIFLAIAKLAGLENEEQMNTCFANAEGRARLERAAKLAQAGEIKSVPNFIINGSIYKDNVDYLPLSKYLESLSTQSFTPMPKP